MKATEDIELILGHHRVMRSRIVESRTSPNRTVMLFKLRDPEETIEIKGADNVTQATLELNYDPTE